MAQQGFFSPRLFICILSLALLFGLVSCDSSNTNAAIESDEVDDSFRSYAVDIDASDVPMTELIEEVEVMRLEETEESLLSNFSRLLRAGDKLILPGGSSGDVHIFSNTGEFINKFNHEGDGPGEYSVIQSVWVEGDSIVLFDNVKQVLHWYDHVGNHLKELKLPERANHVHPFQEGYILDMTFSPISDSLKYNLLVLDEKLNNKNMFVPYEQGVPFPIGGSLASFNDFSGKLSYKPIFSDTIYLVGPEGARPFYSIDFGEKYLWNDRELYGSGQAAMNAIPEGRGVWLFQPKAGINQVFMLYSISFSEYGLMLIDRKTGDYRKLDQSKNAEEKYTFGALFWEEDRLLVTMVSTDVADFLGELGEGQYRFKEGTTLEEIESSENPVLMWVKFKTAFE